MEAKEGLYKMTYEPGLVGHTWNLNKRILCSEAKLHSEHQATRGDRARLRLSTFLMFLWFPILSFN